MKSERELLEEKKILEQMEAIKAVDRKKEIVEAQIIRVLEMKESKQPSTRIVIDNSSAVHNSFFVDMDTAEQIFNVIYTSLTTQREKLICEAQRLIGPTEFEPAKEHEIAPSNG